MDCCQLSEGGRMLSKRNRVVIETLLPSCGTMLPGILETNCEDFVAHFQAGAPFLLLLSWRVSLWVATWIAPLLLLHLPPLDRLPSAQRAAALEAMEKSQCYLLRQFLFVLKEVS